MIILSLVEDISGGDFCGDGSAKTLGAFKLLDECLGFFFLRRGMVENNGSVLCADVKSLAVNLGWIVEAEKVFQKLLVADDRRIKSDFNGFSMPCFSRTD